MRSFPVLKQTLARPIFGSFAFFVEENFARVVKSDVFDVPAHVAYPTMTVQHKAGIPPPSGELLEPSFPCVSFFCVCSVATTGPRRLTRSGRAGTGFEG